jgi:dihydroxy-acid dehydratase
MKTSVISQEFRDRYLSNPSDPEAFEGRRSSSTAARLPRPHQRPRHRHRRQHHPDHPRRGPVGYPGGAEVVNMQPPDALLKQGINELPCIGDGRQSGTSGSPSILNAAPEAAVGGGLALVQTGDRIRIDLNKRRADILIGDDELATRRGKLNGGRPMSGQPDPLAGIQRQIVDQFDNGMV